MIRYIICFLCLFYFKDSLAQGSADTLQTLNAVEVKAYFSGQPILRSPASVSIINSRQLGQYSGISLVSAINTVSGVRMEERSPGSYRLSIRGSLLRSPFGIRNVKIYLDGFPLTDAGGNTYLNLLDAANVGRIEILKGPEASFFGANSGGVVLASSGLNAKDSISAIANISGGSYGLFHQYATFQQKWKNSNFNISEGWQQADGYRDNSALKRKYIQVSQQWNYSAKGKLNYTALVSDLNYQTPGGLNEAQMKLNPRSARLAAGKLLGAAEQHAQIVNKTVFGGLSSENIISDNMTLLTRIYGSNTDFSNPFITTYERRKEQTLGTRVNVNYIKNLSSSILKSSIGFEGANTWSRISNFGNKLGVKDSTQADYKLNAGQRFGFAHVGLDYRKWYLEAAASLNFFSYHYQKLYPTLLTNQTRKFNPEVMPRLAVSYQVLNNFSVRVSTSRGYSAPTLAEILSSDNQVNVALEAENGWNYETGFRLRDKNDIFSLDASVFYYRLKDAIVRRQNSNEQEYFLNAGGTKQIGFESQLMIWVLQPIRNRFIESVQFRNSYALSKFSFDNYKIGLNDFSGNPLTGVPKNTVTNSLNVVIMHAISLFAEHSYTSKISLNDAASAYAKSYQLLQAKLGWKFRKLNFFAGADNLLNVKYSLGNDLNAAANRYFNPAPLRNYYGGLNVAFGRP